MWTHGVITLYRSLMRQRLYSVLNIFGLSTGIVVFVVLTLFVRFQTSFEHWIPGASNIYLVRTIVALPGVPKFTESSSTGLLLSQLQGDYPQIIGTRLLPTTAAVRQADQSTSESVKIVDRNFFDVFDLPFITGDGHSALAEPSSVVLSQTLAKKYFGSNLPLGKTLMIVVDGVIHTQRVTAIIKDIPQNSDLNLGMLIPSFDKPSDYRWGNASLLTFIRLPSSQQASALNAQFDGFVDRHAMTDLGAMSPHPHTLMRQQAVALPSVHLIEPRDSIVVVTLTIVGSITLLLAAVNYINLATARAVVRAREVAMRKVLGATRRTLVVQFMAEALAIVSVAALIGLAVVELALPVINAAGATNLELHYFDRESVVPTVLVAVLVVGIGAGFYPALVISRFQPAAVLASARSPGGGRLGARIREGLVLLQLTVAIAFTVCTFVLVAQTRYVRQASLGFRREGLVLANSFSDAALTSSQRAALLFAFRRLPGVISATEASDAPGNDDFDSEVEFSIRGRPNATMLRVFTGPDYFTTYGAHLLAGRWLDLNHGPDDSVTGSTPPFMTANNENVVLNAEAAKSLSFAEPADAIGASVREVEAPHPDQFFNVVGVTDDLRFHSPRNPVKPTIYFLRSQVPTKGYGYSVAAVRYSGLDPHIVIAGIQAAWRQIAPGIPLKTETAQQNLTTYYRPEEQSSRLFTLGSLVAIMISCVGLFGVASFATTRRIREIGVRKTLGASTRNVLSLLLGQILRPVLVANLLAWPAAYIAMRTWLSGFDQRVALSPMYFLLATLLAFAVAAATVFGQALQVARAEPGRALRHE